MTTLDWLNLRDVIGAITLPAFCCFGAVILYILNKLQGHQPFSLFLAINIDVSGKAPWHTVLMDMLISSLVGGVAVFFIASPSTAAQSIVAGLGMTGILSVVNGGEKDG